MSIQSSTPRRRREASAHPRAALRASLAAALTFGLAASVAARAEETPEDTVVVTATRGQSQSILSSPVPVDSIDRDQLRSAGSYGAEFGQALQSLVPSFNFQRQSNSGAADIVRPAQLRGMSPDQVLVLVNGKRRHTTAVTGIDAKVGRGTAPVDFNSLPTNAIGRVEVLRDGAGAQYGSDAIAGVINVILDERPEGIETRFSYGGHVTGFDPTGETLTDGGTFNASGSAGLPLPGNGFLRTGFEYRDRGETDRAGLDQVPFFEDAGNIPLVGGRQNFKPGDGASEDVNLWLNSGMGLTDSTELYGFATYNHRDAEGTGFFRYPISSANLRAVYPFGYRPITTGDNEDIAGTGGVRGEFAAWNWDASLSYGVNDFESGVRRSLNPALGVTSPTEFHSGNYQNDLLSLNLDVNRGFAVGFASPLTVASGFEYRHQGFESRAGEPASFASGPLAGPPTFAAIGAQAGGGLLPGEERDLNRDVYSVYTELSADVIENVLVTLAGRYENASDFGDSWSGKFATRWEFVPGYALRGAVSNSFRAPSLVQLGFGTSSSSFGAGGILTTVNTLPVDDPVARALGADDLEAETSMNYSVGLTGQLPRDIALTIDFYRIDVDDRITLSERIDCVAPNVTPDAAARCAARNITAANFFTNAVDTRTQGVDVVATHGEPLGRGHLDVSAAYAYNRTKIQNINDPLIAGVVLVGVEESNTLESAAPRHRAILTTTWKDQVFSVLGRLTYFGETTRVFNFGGGFEPEQTYGGEWQFDTEVAARVAQHVELFVGATNLFDNYPDKSIADISYFGNLPYDVLSPIGFNGRFVYAGARLDF